MRRASKFFRVVSQSREIAPECGARSKTFIRNAGWRRVLLFAVTLFVSVVPVSPVRGQTAPAAAERLHALGLAPEYLAAVGVTPAQAPAITAAVSESQGLARYETARMALQSESDAMQAALDAYVTEPTTQHLAAYLAAREATQVQAAALAGLRKQAVLDLLQSCAPGVVAVAAEGVDLYLRGLPPELCVVAWTPEEAAILRRAVRAEAVGTLPSGHPLLQMLSMAKSRPEVIMASGRIAANADAIASALVSGQ